MTRSPQHNRAAMTWYFAVSYLILCWINYANLDMASAQAIGPGAVFFLLNAYAGYNAMYLLPAMLLTWLAGRPGLWKTLRAPSFNGVATQIVAVVSVALTTLFFYANTQLHALYGMFVNGFVVNLVVTPGGLESLGGSAASSLGFALIGAAFFVGHAALLFILKWMSGRSSATRLNIRRLAWPLASVFLVSTLGDRTAYAYTNALSPDTDMLVLTQGVPYYVGLTARHFITRLGFKVSPEEKVASVHGQFRYPARPIAFDKPARPYNIVWLVSESWRADTLNPDIMPNTAAFASQAQTFKLHYSGGNGTRVGVFTMMTGVPGSYWAAFYEGHRSAPLIDVMQQQGYQMSLYTSAKFSYPEFDQTIFSSVSKEQLHWIDGGGDGWQKDRKNVGDMLDFIDKRDPSRPFFTFMFFESPHARYYFPPESVIRRPYRDDINYATMDREELRKDMGLIKNRYLNAVHHLDSQFARVFDYLKAHDLLENTIVVALGDHGEEFMEDGYWGHNSTFSDPQTRTPLILWIPGMKPAVHDKLTSHLDLPATIMPLLGVRNPVSDYSTGIDLLSPEEHEYITLSDWSHIGYKDNVVKITLPMNAQGVVGKKIVGPHDEVLTARQAKTLFKEEQPHLVRLMQEIGRFTRPARN
jgi:membrane-anchored protein YejM (alkaline phosphatase superfamily)